MIRRFDPVFLLPLVLAGCFPTSPGNKADVPDLELVVAYPVKTPGSLEPSGLVFHQGSLFTIADKMDTAIYRVETGPGTARMVPHLIFEPPMLPAMDWEGITTDEEGNFYLISERYGRILKVNPDAENHWISPDLRPKGRKLGLFAKDNAGFEGITQLDDNLWLGAVEREPRGLVELYISAGDSTISPSLQTDSPFLGSLPLLRLPDYSGLDNDNGKVFALFRNAHLIVQLEKDESGWSEISAWSFAYIETDPRWAYITQTFGQAEGLAVNGRDVYIIFDNNRSGRQADANDRRPLLVHARFPEVP